MDEVGTSGTGLMTIGKCVIHLCLASTVVRGISGFSVAAPCIHSSRYGGMRRPSYKDSSRVALRERADNDGDDYEESPNDLLDSLGLIPSKSDYDFDDSLIGYSIDSFLRGEYDRQFAENAPSPHPDLNPGQTVEAALRSLRNLDDPEPAHGAAVFQRFCTPLSRGERWGDSSTVGKDPWKEVLRGALTPFMFARRLRASPFSALLDWSRLDVTEGGFTGERDRVGVPSIAFVTAALYFEDGTKPSLISFSLRRRSGLWLIDTARRIEDELDAGSTEVDQT